MADALGGVPWDSGGGISLVGIKRADGHLVVVSNVVINQFEEIRRHELADTTA